jgi:hypothetical protein
LYHLRQRGESRFLWIDALSIDQQNLEERNFHVQLMGKIYQSADRVIVWLGMPSDDRRQARAMEFVAEMATFLRRQQPAAAATAALFKDVYLLDPKQTQRWSNLLELCRGAYWTRTWIIQEFLQAAVVEVLCGTAHLNWKSFEDVVRSVRELVAGTSSSITTPGSSSAVVWPAFVHLFTQTIPFRLTSRRISHTESTLEELLAEFYDSKCAERRDKVYGILGIADDCGEEFEGGPSRGPQPDYSKHIVEVYFEVFNYLRLSSSSSERKLPLQTVYLTQRVLEIAQADLVSYCVAASDAGGLNAKMSNLRCPLVPDYVNTIDEVLPGWTSMRDLRQRLEQVDWAKYVGHEVKRKTSRPPPRAPGATSSSSSTATTTTQQRKPNFFTKNFGFGTGTTEAAATVKAAAASAKQTEYVRAPLPVDLIENVVQSASSHSEDIRHLHNYPSSSSGCCILTEHVLLDPEDKRRANNPNLAKPSIVIESNPGLGIDPVRVGFACTDARAGDLICQFEGVDIAIIARRIGSGSDEIATGGGAGGGLKIVGRAKMVGHAGLKEKSIHPGCRSGKGAVTASGGASTITNTNANRHWSGIVYPNDQGCNGNEEGWEMLTDPVSLWEILGSG